MKKPNLLFIFTDQQRTDTMRCYGNQLIETPGMNALAEESFVFENAYVSQPVCSPSRATLLTGLYPHASGVPSCNVPLPADTPTIAELISDEYLCAYMGKWHLGDEIFPQHGFSEWVGTEDSYRRGYSSTESLSELSPYHHHLMENGFTPDSEILGQRVFSRHLEASLDEPFTKAAFLGDRAGAFIRENRDRPFVLFVNYLEPHPPHTSPLNDLYDPWSLPTGPAFMQRPPANAPLLNRLMAAFYMESEDYGCDLRSEEGWRRLQARYWGNVTLVDRSVEKILRALDESGQADETIVVFTSDHGEQMGDHGILGKTLMYEESVKVPLLLRVPAFGREMKKIEGNISHIDLLPTLLELMGEPVPGDLQGESRVSVLEGKDTLEGNDVFIEWNGSDGHHPRSIGEAEVNRSMAQPLRTVVTAERWKLNLYESGPGELYDLNIDPHEMENLYDRPEQRNRVLDLAARIERWQERTGDRVSLPSL
jgi:arylsulfatase A-like enzyme